MERQPVATVCTEHFYRADTVCDRAFHHLSKGDSGNQTRTISLVRRSCLQTPRPIQADPTGLFRVCIALSRNSTDTMGSMVQKAHAFETTNGTPTYKSTFPRYSRPRCHGHDARLRQTLHPSVTASRYSPDIWKTRHILHLRGQRVECGATHRFPRFEREIQIDGRRIPTRIRIPV